MTELHLFILGVSETVSSSKLQSWC